MMAVFSAHLRSRKESEALIIPCNFVYNSLSFYVTLLALNLCMLYNVDLYTGFFVGSLK